MIMKRDGYYVEGKFFANRVAQAIAYAQFRSNEFGREVTIQVKEFNCNIRDYGTTQRSSNEIKAA